MSDADALLAAIRAAPDDDAPRLVYADWLEEHGQPERAEFIRIQCELARNASPELRQRETELLDAHRYVFAGPLAADELRFRFHRGFIIGFGHTGVFAATYPRATTKSLLRFFPDGLVINTWTARPAEDVVNYFHRGNEFLAQGTYTLSAFDYPAGIQFSCALTNNEGVVDYRGALEGSFLYLDVHSRVTGHHRRQRFDHVPISGFDSFAEL